VTASPERVEEVRAALETALSDFQSPTPVDLRLETGRSRGDDLVWVWGREGHGAGFWVEQAPQGTALLVAVADFLQDQVFDQLADTWGEARPPCPGHAHAPDPRELDAEVWWVCPRTGERIGRIGHLGRS